MTVKTKILDDGTEISQDAFGAIFGGGMKKALNTRRKLMIAGQAFYFSIAELDKLQELINVFQAENEQLRARITELELASIGPFGLPLRRPRGRPRKNPIEVAPVTPVKPRIRVKANSHTQERTAA